MQSFQTSWRVARGQKQADKGFEKLRFGPIKQAIAYDVKIRVKPEGCLISLRATLGSLAGLDAIVAGRSILVGQPMAQLLLAEKCTVRVAHFRTRDLASKVGRADIVVTAVGSSKR